jgi:predicted nuclease of predicted toxin-antitoxin system
MKILVDEHIPFMTVQALRLLSHDVRDIRGTPDEGMQDDAPWAMARREERLLITTDKGLTQYLTARHYGVLVIRLRRPNRHRIHQRVMQAVTRFGERDWLGLWSSCGVSRSVPGTLASDPEPNTSLRQTGWEIH